MEQELTAQQVFDHTLNHMRKQKFASINKDCIRCAYRGQNGTSCAVGCLLTDEECSPYMNSRSVESLQGEGLLPLRLIAHLELLSSLQFLHDLNMPRTVLTDRHPETTMHVWEKKMEKLAAKVGLIYTPPELEV